MSERAKQIVDRLCAGGIAMAASLPDSWLAPLLDEIDVTSAMTHVRVAREDDAVAIAGGAALMGTRAAVLCQNAGLLLSTNVLAAFAWHHQLPLLVVAVDRGGPDDGFFYQAYKSQVAASVAASAGLTVHRVGGPADNWLFERGIEQAWLQRRPVVLLCARAALIGDGS
jgi:sulfopyruvate decarboxylase TPP-binding subunit